MQKKLLPVWNLPPEQPLAPGSRDPLGFQRYATRFADKLLPNLTVLTTRARYYAFLAWALDEIATDFEPTLPAPICSNLELDKSLGCEAGTLF